ncbi:fimbrial protein [Achromobacter sp. ESBL13]|uniref:fimbrial protein n=1 Tax=Achromobacter sp. ESBL13 TaxID=3077328 RepID=UPI002FC5FAFE
MEPLTTQSQMHQVLYEREAPLAISFRVATLPGMTEKHKLFTAAMWRNPTFLARGIVATNVAGIGMRMMFRDTVIELERVSLIIDAADLTVGVGGLGGMQYMPFIQQLVLMARPEDLPRDLNVTGVAPSTALVLQIFTNRAGATAPGQVGIRPPTWQPPPQTIPPGLTLCSMMAVYQGSQILEIGLGGTVPGIVIKHQCDAGAHQDIRVDMPPAFVADFPFEGATAAPKPFNIRLNKCSALARPQVKFRAKSGLVPGTDTVLALHGPSGKAERPARGIGVIVVDAQDRRVRFGPVGGAYGPDYAMTLMDGSAQLSLAARYIRTARDRDDVQGGVANAAAEFTFEFP